VETTDQYTDFSFDIRPTVDFIGELLSFDAGIEVLEPSDLRQKLQKLIHTMLQRYEE